MQMIEGVELCRGNGEGVKPLEESDINRITGGGYYGSWLVDMPMGGIKYHETVSDWLTKVTFAHIPKLDNSQLITMISVAFGFGQLTMDNPVYRIENAKYGVVTFRKPDAPVSPYPERPQLPEDKGIVNEYKINSPKVDLTAIINGTTGNWLVELPSYRDMKDSSWFDVFRNEDTKFVHVSESKSGALKFRTYTGLAMNLLTISKILYLKNSEYVLVTIDKVE